MIIATISYNGTTYVDATLTASDAVCSDVTGGHVWQATMTIRDAQSGVIASFDMRHGSVQHAEPEEIAALFEANAAELWSVS